MMKNWMGQGPGPAQDAPADETPDPAN